MQAVAKWQYLLFTPRSKDNIAKGCKMDEQYCLYPFVEGYCEHKQPS
jgi:hypothetical protein